MKKYIDRQLSNPTSGTNNQRPQNPSDVLTLALTNNQLSQDPSAVVPNTQNTVDRRMASPPTPAAAHGPLHPSIVVPNSQGTVDPATSLLPRPVAAQVRTDASLMEIRLTEAPSDQSSTHHPATSAPPPTAAAQASLVPTIFNPPHPVAVHGPPNGMDAQSTSAPINVDPVASTTPSEAVENPEETIYRITGVRATETMAPAHGSSQLRYMFNEKDLIMRTKNIVFQPMTMYQISSQHRPYCLVLSVKPLRDGSSVRGADATNNNIRGVFQKLGFRVILIEDPTAEHMQTYLAQLGKRNDHGLMAVVFLSGPFNTNEIIGSDGQPFNVDHISTVSKSGQQAEASVSRYCYPVLMPPTDQPEQ